MGLSLAFCLNYILVCSSYLKYTAQKAWAFEDISLIDHCENELSIIDLIIIFLILKMPMAENTKYSATFLNEIFIQRGIYSPTIILLDKAVKVQLFT